RPLRMDPAGQAGAHTRLAEARIRIWPVTGETTTGKRARSAPGDMIPAQSLARCRTSLPGSASAPEIG
ncbi:MAG: hypothetical protein N3A55_01350, partial [Methylohalobius sp.]|nr:hypothetical protein [Methylohalobius sp.]